jgi:hypothetical protein
VHEENPGVPRCSATGAILGSTDYSKTACGTREPFWKSEMFVDINEYGVNNSYRSANAALNNDDSGNTLARGGKSRRSRTISGRSPIYPGKRQPPQQAIRNRLRRRSLL